MHRTLIVLFCCTCSTPAYEGAAASQRRDADGVGLLAVTHVTVVDPKEARSLADHTVIVDGRRIQQIGPATRVSVPRGATVLDGRGRWLIPGLWDMHVHTGWPARDFPLYLANGVTAVRDMGGAADANPPRDPSPFSAPWTVLRPFRNDTNGPTLVAGGVMLDGPNPSRGALPITTPATARSAVATLATEGVDFIKVGTGITPEQYAAAVDEATRLGLTVAGHVPRGMTAVDVAHAGQRSIEHLMGLPQDCFVTGNPGEGCIAALQQLRDRGVWQVPTLTAWRNRLMGDSPDVRSRPELRYVRDLAAGWERDTTNRLRTRVVHRPDGRQQFEQFVRLVGAMRQNRVPLLAGTDCGNPYTVHGFSLHHELGWLVAAGYSPAQALAAATIEPARFLRRDRDVGTIEAAKLANLVLLRGDPLVDIANVARIEAVVLGGRLLTRRHLDQMLDAAAKARR